MDEEESLVFICNGNAVADTDKLSKHGMKVNTTQMAFIIWQEAEKAMKAFAAAAAKK